MALTRGEIITASELEIQDSVSIDTELALNWLNELEQKCWEIMTRLDPYRNVSTQSYIVTTDPQTESLPSGFDNINAPELGFWELDDDSEKHRKLEQGYEGFEGFSYYLQGSNVHFTGYTDTETIKLYYIAKYSKKTVWEEDDTLIIPEEYKRLCIEWILVNFYRWEKEPENEIPARGRYDEELLNFETRYTRDKESFNMPNESLIVNY